MSFYQLVFHLSFVLTLNQSCFVFGKTNYILNRMYNVFPRFSYGFCIRRLNASHQTGCTADRAIGMLVVAHSIAEINWALDIDRGPDPIILALPLEVAFANKEFLQIVQKEGPRSRLSGIILLYDIRRTDHSLLTRYSADAACPNRKLSLYGEDAPCKAGYPHRWNRAAYFKDGLTMLQLPVPFAVLYEPHQLKQLFSCWTRHGARPGRSYNAVCAVQMDWHMNAYKDSATCLRRHKLSQQRGVYQSFCTPVGDYNVVASSANLPLGSVRKSNSVVALVARMDGLSLFQDLSPASNSVIAALITTLVTAEVLFKKPELRTADTDVLMILFQAESLDYIGSKRVVYDMQNHDFLGKKVNIHHIYLRHLRSLIEISEVGLPSEENHYFLHVDNERQNYSSSLLEDLMAAEGIVRFKRPRGNNTQLPPASVQSFLAQRDEIPTVVITDFSTHFHSSFYHSVLDKKLALNIVQQLTNLGTKVARGVYTQATGKRPPSSLVANRKTVEQLVECYVYNSTCSLVQARISSKQTLLEMKLTGAPLPTMSNSFSGKPNRITSLTYYLASLLLGERLNDINEKQCNIFAKKNYKPYSYEWVPGFIKFSNDSQRDPFCLRHSLQLTPAQSPAVIISNYNWSMNGPYPTWTESYWESPQIMVFLMPSRAWEMVILMIGCTVVIITALLTYGIQNNADQIFRPLVMSEELRPLMVFWPTPEGSAHLWS